MIRLAVIGAMGRMGSMIARLARNSEEVSVAALVERQDHPGVGEAFPHTELELLGDLHDIHAPIDVCIDFTTPTCTLKTLAWAARKGVAAVTGTTGFTPEDLEQIQAVSRKTAVVYSPNMSPGINTMLELVRLTAQMLPAYDTEIVELHHRHKVDAPSGTALKLARTLQQAGGKDRTACFGREGRTGARPDGEIGVMALRGGEVVGEHTVLFLGDTERIEITHRAQSREVFAHGALLAARWVYGKPEGLYGMSHVLAVSGNPQTLRQTPENL